MYTVRITREEFLPIPTGLLDPCIFYQEGDGVKVKHHLQGICYAEVTATTLRRWLREAGLKGNTDFSISQVEDEEKYLAYICKEGRLYHNSTSIEMSKYAGKFVKNDKTKKSKLELIFEGTDTLHTGTLVSHAIDYYVTNKMLVDARLIAKYVETWQLLKDDGKFKIREKFQKKIMLLLE